MKVILNLHRSAVFLTIILATIPQAAKLHAQSADAYMRAADVCTDRHPNDEIAAANCIASELGLDVQIPSTSRQSTLPSQDYDAPNSLDLRNNDSSQDRYSPRQRQRTAGVEKPYSSAGTPCVSAAGIEPREEYSPCSKADSSNCSRNKCCTTRLRWEFQNACDAKMMVRWEFPGYSRNARMHVLQPGATYRTGCKTNDGCSQMSFTWSSAD